jgi:hypothetical protein
MNFLVTEPKSIAMGYNSKTEGNNSVAVGHYAASTKDNSISLGSTVSTIHKNSVVIGSNLSSKHENSILFSQAEITETSIDHNGGTSIISGKNIVRSTQCSACEHDIDHGVTWIRDDYVTNETNEKFPSFKLGLCFNCILDCVLEFKAKQSWFSYQDLK